MIKITRKQRVRRKLRVRTDRPRLSVFISNKHVYAQVIDDKLGKTLVFAMDKNIENHKGGLTEVSYKVGGLIAEKAVEKGISEVVFDRGGKKYHGRIKAVAEGAREKGLKF